MQHFQQPALHLIDSYGYFGLFFTLILGNVGAPVGAELLMTAAGALVATGHLSNLWLAIAVGVAGELSGQAIAYAIGCYGGRPAVRRFGKYVRIHQAELDRIDGFFARWGTFAIFLCRFIPVVRGIVGIPAGIARMNLAAFFAWTFAGSAIFCGGLALIGHAFGKHVDRIEPLLHKSGYVVIGLIALAIVALVAYAAIRVRAGKRREALAKDAPRTRALD